MHKKNNILSYIIFYNIIPIIILGVILFIGSGHVSILIRDNFERVQRDIKLYSIINNGIKGFFLFIWLYYSGTTIRSRRYKYLTGRSYGSDHGEFQKSYGELVSFFQKNDPHKLDTSTLPLQSWKESDGVILCKIKDRLGKYRLLNIPSKANGNLISFGLPGSGKTTTQGAVAALRFNSKRPGGCGVFAISIKGDLLNFVKGKRKNIKLFTPDKLKGSCHYNPLYGFNQMSISERKVFVQNMAIIICPDEAGDNSKYFVDGARDYFCGITLYLQHLFDKGEYEGKLCFPNLINAILNNNVADVTESINDSDCEEAGEFTNSYKGSNEKNLTGVYNHLVKCVRPLISGALKTLFDGKGDCIRPEDLAKHDIYIDVPQDKFHVYSTAMGLIITNFLQAFMRRSDVSSNKKTLPVLFLLDEFPQLHIDYSSILNPAMSTLRSKGVKLFLLMQSYQQLVGVYGETHAREIMDLCAYVSVFNAQDPQSRRYFQDLIGKRKMLKASSSVSESAKTASSGKSVSVVDEYIIDEADLGNLNIQRPDGSTIHRVLVYANGKYCIGETCPCYE